MRKQMLRSSHKRTLVASLVGIVIIIPATVIGAAVGTIYQWVLSFFLNAPGWLSFLPWLKDFAMIWFPALLSGAVAGLISISTTAVLFKSANIKAVSWFVAAVSIAIPLLSWAMHLLADIPLPIPLLPLFAQTAGMVFGIFISWRYLTTSAIE